MMKTPGVAEYIAGAPISVQQQPGQQLDTAGVEETACNTTAEDHDLRDAAGRHHRRGGGARQDSSGAVSSRHGVVRHDHGRRGARALPPGERPRRREGLGHAHGHAELEARLRSSRGEAWRRRWFSMQQQQARMF